MGQCSRSARGGIILVDDVLEFVLVAEFSRSKLQTVQVDDGSYDDVVVVAVWPLVVEIIYAEDRESRRWKKIVCGRSTDDLRNKHLSRFCCDWTSAKSLEGLPKQNTAVKTVCRLCLCVERQESSVAPA